MRKNYGKGVAYEVVNGEGRIYGRITAIDMNTGDTLWMIPTGDTPERIKNHPALEGVDLPNTGVRSQALTLVSRTLLMYSEGRGGRPLLYAVDKADGTQLGAVEMPAPATSIPMSYMHEGPAVHRRARRGRSESAAGVARDAGAAGVVAFTARGGRGGHPARQRPRPADRGRTSRPICRRARTSYSRRRTPSRYRTRHRSRPRGQFSSFGRCAGRLSRRNARLRQGVSAPVLCANREGSSRRAGTEPNGSPPIVRPDRWIALDSSARAACPPASRLLTASTTPIRRVAVVVMFRVLLQPNA